MKVEKPRSLTKYNTQLLFIILSILLDIYAKYVFRDWAVCQMSGF